MEDSSSHDSKGKWYVWGTILTWTLSIPVIIAIFNSLREISEQKATGIGAVAGWFGRRLCDIQPHSRVRIARGSNCPAGQVFVWNASDARPTLGALHLLVRIHTRSR
jgi:hypothetical protein